MLVEFKVEKFRNFKEECIFKLDDMKNYEFSMPAVNNGIGKTSLIYGMNGSGKSNLGSAILDISGNLTDKEKDTKYYKKPFINLESEGPAKFYYKFKFDDMFLEYKYEKDTAQNIGYEEVFINEDRVIYYDHRKQEGDVILKGTETLNKDLNEKNISFVKYIKSNSVLVEDEYVKVFNDFIDFVDNMLLFSSLEHSHYQGFKNGSETIAKAIVEKEKVEELQEFLAMAGIKYNLSAKEQDGEKLIMCNFKDKKVNLYSIASRGTATLILFYYWLLELDKVSLVFIDEFDAFYHNKLARMVVEEVLKRKAQAIITTHNTSIMDNSLLRPDCYYNLVDGKIKSFANSTTKELRKAHNMEKMYRAGSFCE